MILGNPDKFNGTGIVAFIDVLGFSKEIETNWGSENDNPLRKILELKKHIPKHTNRRLSKESKESKTVRTYMCRVQTISDSVIVSFGFEDKIIMGDLMLGMTTFFDTISVIWRNALVAGFTVRGAVDFGSIYWDKNEIIGPAFINAYRLEQTHAKTSRVILSSVFNMHLSRVYNKGDKSLWDDHFLKYLRKDNDGLIMLNPHSLYDNDEEKKFIVDSLKKLRDRAKLHDKEKYSPVLAALASENVNLNKSDLGNY